MSAVDVLAVMDSAIARNLERGATKGSPSDKGLREARAAVAELIAAVEDVYGSTCVDEVNAADDPCQPGCMSCRIRAALIGCKGGAK